MYSLAVSKPKSMTNWRDTRNSKGSLSRGDDGKSSYFATSKTTALEGLPAGQAAP